MCLYGWVFSFSRVHYAFNSGNFPMTYQRTSCLECWFHLHAYVCVPANPPGCLYVLTTWVWRIAKTYEKLSSQFPRTNMNWMACLFRITGDAFSSNFFEGLGSNFDDYADQLDDSGRVVWLGLMCVKVTIELVKLIVFKMLDPIGLLWCRLTRRYCGKQRKF